MCTSLCISLCTSLIAACLAMAAHGAVQAQTLSYIGQQTVATGTAYQGTTVGGAVDHAGARARARLGRAADDGSGAGKNGRVCGLLFAGDVAGEPLDLTRELSWLAGNQPGFVWLHFNLADATAEGWIREHLAVVPECFEALHEGSRAPRIEDASDTLVAVINDVAFAFAFDPSEIEALWVHVAPRLALSARLRPLRSIDRLRQAVKDGCRFDSSVSLLNHLLHDQGAVRVRIVREATV
jgi:Mg2+ and Co2+ transporter CorA